MTVNHGVPGSSPGEGANKKVTRNSDFFRLKSTHIQRFLWFESHERVMCFLDIFHQVFYMRFSVCAKNMPRVGLDIGNPTSVFLLTLSKLEVVFDIHHFFIHCKKLHVLSLIVKLV